MFTLEVSAEHLIVCRGFLNGTSSSLCKKSMNRPVDFRLSVLIAKIWRYKKKTTERSFSCNLLKNEFYLNYTEFREVAYIDTEQFKITKS